MSGYSKKELHCFQHPNMERREHQLHNQVVTQYGCPEKRGYGLPNMPGGRGIGRKSLYPVDDGGREELQGETEGAG